MKSAQLGLLLLPDGSIATTQKRRAPVGNFFGTFQFRERDPKEQAFEMLGVMLGGMAGLAAFAAFISLLVWLIRAVIDHRRWLRLSRVQTEVHSKLMDRMTTNDDLLAYIQSPAGRRFLAGSGPAAWRPGPPMEEASSQPLIASDEPITRSGRTGRIENEKKTGLVLLRRAKQGVAEWCVLEMLENPAAASRSTPTRASTSAGRRSATVLRGSSITCRPDAPRADDSSAWCSRETNMVRPSVSRSSGG